MWSKYLEPAAVIFEKELSISDEASTIFTKFDLKLKGVISFHKQPLRPVINFPNLQNMTIILFHMLFVTQRYCPPSRRILSCIIINSDLMRKVNK